MKKHKVQDSVVRALASVVSLHLRIRSGGCGLLGDFFMALNGLLFAQKIGASATPVWGSGSLYFDENYGPNAWNYFFEYSSPSRDGDLAIPYFPNALGFRAADGKTAREVASAAVRKYGRPTAPIEHAVDALFRARLEGKYSVGVHVRGTDVARGLESRFAVRLDDYDRELERLDKLRPIDAIYLASDEVSAVHHFQTRYGARLVIQDECLRSTDGSSLHGHYDSGVAGSGYSKGVQVLIDALVLARCSYLIRGHSKVTCYSLCVNPHLPFTDLERAKTNRTSTPWLFE